MIFSCNVDRDKLVTIKLGAQLTGIAEHFNGNGETKSVLNATNNQHNKNGEAAWHGMGKLINLVWQFEILMTSSTGMDGQEKQS